jgi:prepilin-type processing-associated H-X9-DG protein
VVVAIIALLVAILLPSLNRARAQARTSVCIVQIRQLMAAALMYTQEHEGRLPGTGINDEVFKSQYEAQTRKDWLSWVGTWYVLYSMDDVGNTEAWKHYVPQKGRLWKYYRDENILKCPAAEKFNGKFSYSTPENVSCAMVDRNDGRPGLPPVMDKVKHTSWAIQFLDEDEENGLSNYSVDDGFGEPDMFADRHVGQATAAFFDGHAAAHFYPRGPGSRTDHRGYPTAVRYARNKSPEAFEAWMIQIAPFNSRFTPRPWKWSGRYEDWPKFKAGNNKPGCDHAFIGCE